jgi:hypothetical protein
MKRLEPVALAVAVLSFWVATARAQEPEQEPPADPQAEAREQPLSFIFASAPIRPGSPAYVNAIFANRTEFRVMEIRSSVEFSRDKLVFVGLRNGIAADIAGAQATIEYKDKTGAKVAAKEQAAALDISMKAKIPLPDGVLYELQFKLVDEAREQLIHIKQTAEAIDPEGKPIRGFGVAGGQVTVAAVLGAAPPPIMGCFFYMH